MTLKDKCVETAEAVVAVVDILVKTAAVLPDGHGNFLDTAYQIVRDTQHLPMYPTTPMADESEKEN